MMDLIKTILHHHDEYSRDSSLGPSHKWRTESYIKAEAIRELLTRIKEGLPEKEKEKFIEAVESHIESMAKLTFYKRNLNLED